jgi:hypothetical protein
MHEGLEVIAQFDGVPGKRRRSGVSGGLQVEGDIRVVGIEPDPQAKARHRLGEIDRRLANRLFDEAAKRPAFAAPFGDLGRQAPRRCERRLVHRQPV